MVWSLKPYTLYTYIKYLNSNPENQPRLQSDEDYWCLGFQDLGVRRVGLKVSGSRSWGFRGLRAVEFRGGTCNLAWLDFVRCGSCCCHVDPGYIQVGGLGFMPKGAYVVCRGISTVRNYDVQPH